MEVVVVVVVVVVTALLHHATLLGLVARDDGAGGDDDDGYSRQEKRKEIMDKKLVARLHAARASNVTRSLPDWWPPKEIRVISVLKVQLECAFEGRSVVPHSLREGWCLFQEWKITLWKRLGSAPERRPGT